MSFSKIGTMISDLVNFATEKYHTWDYPEWLNSVRGESPLLERSEVEFIADVRRSIIREAKSRPSFPCDDPLKHKLSVMKDNFEEVVKYLRKNSRAKDYFVQNYPEWRRFRNLTITQLKDIAKAINVNSRESTAARTGGSYVSLVGGLVCLATGAGALRLVGCALTGLASLVSAATTAMEFDLLRKKVKEAEKVIREDMEYSGKMWDWICNVSCVHECFNTIKSIDVDRNLRKTAIDLHACFKNKSSAKQVKIIIERAMQSFKISPDTINEISDVIGILIAIFMLYDRYRHFFTRAYEAYKCNTILSTSFDFILTTAKLESAVSAGKCAKLTTFQKSRIGIGMVFDIINIIHASKASDSMSKEAVEIAKVAEKLKKEAEEFKKLYEAMNVYKLDRNGHCI